MAVFATRDMEARLRHFSVSAAELKTRVETLRGLTRPLELAEANIHAGQSKVAHLSELVGHIKALRALEPPYMLHAPYARPPADRASYFTAAAPLLQQCRFHWAALTSFTPAPSPGVPPTGRTAASGPAACDLGSNAAAQKLSGPPPHPLVEDPVQTAKTRAAEAQFAGHPRLIRVRQALTNLSDAVIAHCRAEFQAAIDVLRHQPLETQALSRVAANCHAPVLGPMISCLDSSIHVGVFASISTGHSGDRRGRRRAGFGSTGRGCSGSAECRCPLALAIPATQTRAALACRR